MNMTKMMRGFQSSVLLLAIVLPLHGCRITPAISDREKLIVRCESLLDMRLSRDAPNADAEAGVRESSIEAERIEYVLAKALHGNARVRGAIVGAQSGTLSSSNSGVSERLRITCVVVILDANGVSLDGEDSVRQVVEESVGRALAGRYQIDTWWKPTRAGELWGAYFWLRERDAQVHAGQVQNVDGPADR